eukprot:1137106-Pelagomonas_calceolata.AAC.2
MRAYSHTTFTPLRHRSNYSMAVVPFMVMMPLGHNQQRALCAAVRLLHSTDEYPLIDALVSYSHERAQRRAMLKNLSKPVTAMTPRDPSKLLK